MREEYTRETYPSFGKKYNGEKAIISMTSWRARIATCAKTIYSLLKQCPGFHIVLVLSEEEFPKMMDELPENLKLLVDNELIEVLWVYKNYKSLKKIIFTMDKYRDIPVISADDDCIYTCNYAQELYNKWQRNKDCLITFNNTKPRRTLGASTLYFPKCFGSFNLHAELETNQHIAIYENADDSFYEMLRAKYRNPRIIGLRKIIFLFCNDKKPLRNIYGKNNYMKMVRKVQSIDSKRNIFSIIGND